MNVLCSDARRARAQNIYSYLKMNAPCVVTVGCGGSSPPNFPMPESVGNSCPPVGNSSPVPALVPLSSPVPFAVGNRKRSLDLLVDFVALLCEYGKHA